MISELNIRMVVVRVKRPYILNFNAGEYYNELWKYAKMDICIEQIILWEQKKKQLRIQFVGPLAVLE